MPSTDNAHQGHVVLRTVLITLAVGVLLACMMAGWYVHEAGSDAISGQQTASADVDASHG